MGEVALAKPKTKGVLLKQNYAKSQLSWLFLLVRDKRKRDKGIVLAHFALVQAIEKKHVV